MPASRTKRRLSSSSGEFSPFKAPSEHSRRTSTRNSLSRQVSARSTYLSGQPRRSSASTPSISPPTLSDATSESGNSMTVSASHLGATGGRKLWKEVSADLFSNPITISGVTLIPTIAFRTFWWFAAERKAIDDKRRAGEPAPWTEDETLQNYFFCNTFRVLDKVSQYLIMDVIEKGSQKEEEVVFRTILFNLFTKIETWELLDRKLGPLSWKTYSRDRYAAVLDKAFNSGMALYTGAFIKPAPKFGYSTNYMNHLCFLETLMTNNITNICKYAKHMADVFEWLVSFPSLGDFSTYQLMLSLSYTKVLNFHRNDFVVTGPGSLSGLGKIFGQSFKDQVNDPGFAEDVMRYLAENQQHYFDLGGFGFSGLGPEKLLMDIADVEHTLCEVDKYCRVAHPHLKGKRTHLHRTFRVDPLRPCPALVIPKAWNHHARRTPRVREDKKLDIDKRYVIESLMEHRQTETSLEYRIRWQGYTEQDDTWESEEHLTFDAPDALKEYKRVRGLQ